ncbi:class II fructose-bisphosphate aldolase [Nibricoccus sp. IMCC34717]|uniref:class II fructose-bisphosphate aldolase n=1 Tax=Nibricoccus sp. IMCC34717 TaxID=3034021 RepID=UPI00384C1304
MLLNPIHSRLLLQHALANHYAILAVNADSHACVTDCLEAARECDAPIIIETSLWQLKSHAYGFGDPILGLTRYLAELAALADSPRYKSIPVIFHTDHIKGPETVDILTAALKGVPLALSNSKGMLRASTVSLDASELTDEQNIDLLCQLARVGRDAGVPGTFEMESEVDEGATPLDRSRKLISAVEGREPESVWIYAPGLGTQHGLTPGGYPDFRVERIHENTAMLFEVTGRRIGLALHGSSGLDEANLAAAARAGVIKVNWSSESLLIRSKAAQSFYAENAAQLEPGHKQWKATAMDNGVQSYVSKIYLPRVKARIALLNGTGQASQFVAGLRG